MTAGKVFVAVVLVIKMSTWTKGFLAEDYMELAGFGAPFTLGMLYNAQLNQIIPGVTLWDADTLSSNVIRNYSSRFSQFSMEAYNSIEDFFSATEFNAELKMAFMANELALNGHAKLLHHQKVVNNEDHLYLTYKGRTVFRQLPMEILKREEVKYAVTMIDQVATHVVIAIIYGADVTFDFYQKNTSDLSRTEFELTLLADYNKDTNRTTTTTPPSTTAASKAKTFDAEEEAESNNEGGGHRGENTTQTTTILSTVSSTTEGGRAKLGVNLTASRNSTSIQLSVKYIGDLFLRVPPKTYLEAKKIYQKLPENFLGEENNVTSGNGVPKRIYLMSLSKLNDVASYRRTAKVTEKLVAQTEELLERYNKYRRINGDLEDMTVTNMFVHLKLWNSQFRAGLIGFRDHLQNELNRLQENSLSYDKFFRQIDHSPFAEKYLGKYAEDIGTETSVLEAYIAGLTVDNIEVALNNGIYKRILNDISLDNLIILRLDLNPSRSPSAKWLKMAKSFVTEGSARNTTALEKWFLRTKREWFRNETVTSAIMPLSRLFIRHANQELFTTEKTKFIVATAVEKMKGKGVEFGVFFLSNDYNEERKVQKFSISDPPANLIAAEDHPGSLKISWNSLNQTIITRYIVKYRLGRSLWNYVALNTANSVLLKLTTVGTYEIVVMAIYNHPEITISAKISYQLQPKHLKELLPLCDSKRYEGISRCHVNKTNGQIEAFESPGSCAIRELSQADNASANLVFVGNSDSFYVAINSQPVPTVNRCRSIRGLTEWHIVTVNHTTNVQIPSSCPTLTFSRSCDAPVLNNMLADAEVLTKNIEWFNYSAAATKISDSLSGRLQKSIIVYLGIPTSVASCDPLLPPTCAFVIGKPTNTLVAIWVL